MWEGAVMWQVFTQGAMVGIAFVGAAGLVKVGWALVRAVDGVRQELRGIGIDIQHAADDAAGRPRGTMARRS